MPYKWNGRHGKGAGRADRQLKREEAEKRNAATLHENRKAHRLGRCVEHGHTHTTLADAKRRRKTRKGQAA